MPKELNKAAIREFLFCASVHAKGLDAPFEIAAAIPFWLISPSSTVRLTTLLTQDEVAEDARDLFANYLRYAAGRLSVNRGFADKTGPLPISEI